MHGSLHLIIANENINVRQAEAAKARSRRFASSRPAGAIARFLANRAPAQGIPTRAAPGPEHRSPLGHTAAAPLRGR